METANCDKSEFALVIVEGSDTGKVFPLGRQPVSVGRGREDSFLIRDPAVTREQLAITWDAESCCHVLCQKGDSSMFINNIGASRLAGVRHALMHGDQIQIGGTVLRYRRRSS